MLLLLNQSLLLRLCVLLLDSSLQVQALELVMLLHFLLEGFLAPHDY